MKLARVRSILPDWKNVLAALASAILLIGAFPDFEFWFLAWFALVPLLWAVERETERGHSCPPERDSVRKDVDKLSKPVRPSGSWGHECPRSFVLGWVFGNVFFFGTCWWLTFAPITYAGFPAPLAYFLLFLVTSVAAVFPGIFAAITAFLLRRFGSTAFLAVPFVWVFTEFLRYWLTGNSWNAVGYSQAFRSNLVSFSILGGVHVVSFLLLGFNAIFAFTRLRKRKDYFWLILPFGFLLIALFPSVPDMSYIERDNLSTMVVIQPNVPMSGLTLHRWKGLRKRHIQLAEEALTNPRAFPDFIDKRAPDVVIFPESPMNFMYEDDPETKEFINGFATRNNVSVLFNSAEPDKSNGKFFNSAVMVGPEGKEVAQYDKIYLLPFGEAVPFPLEGLLPGFVGNFSYGREYDLLPLGEAKAGVMICFESHFGQLSREYVRNDADVIIEMTNDGYLGPTPVLRQHLANAVFRAVETNRPVLRVTNVGITAYINERGAVLDPAVQYTEDTRVWSVAKSDGGQTFYVKYGDWFAWLCVLVTLGCFGYAVIRRVRLST